MANEKFPLQASNNDSLATEKLRKENLLLDLQLANAQEALERKQQEQEDKYKARLAGAKSQEDLRIKNQLRQERCDHRKPNGTTQFVGQRLHDGKTVFQCQACQKEYLDTPQAVTMPSNLRPPQEWVGGFIAA